MNLFLLSASGSFEDYSLGQGIVVAVTGILTVIFILAVISLCIVVVAKVIYAIEHKGEKKIIRKPVHTEPAPVVSTPKTVDVREEAPKQEEKDDKELVAAITAAIAASMNTTTDRLVVRSFRRASNWHKEAIQVHRHNI